MLTYLITLERLWGGWWHFHRLPWKSTIELENILLDVLSSFRNGNCGEAICHVNCQFTCDIPCVNFIEKPIFRRRKKTPIYRPHAFSNENFTRLCTSYALLRSEFQPEENTRERAMREKRLGEDNIVIISLYGNKCNAFRIKSRITKNVGWLQYVIPVSVHLKTK